MSSESLVISGLWLCVLAWDSGLFVFVPSSSGVFDVSLAPGDLLVGKEFGRFRGTWLDRFGVCKRLSSRFVRKCGLCDCARFHTPSCSLANRQICGMLARFVVRLVSWSKDVYTLCLCRVFGVGFEKFLSTSPISMTKKYFSILPDGSTPSFSLASGQICGMLAWFVVRLVTWSKVVFSLYLCRVFGVGFENSFNDFPISDGTIFSWAPSIQPDNTPFSLASEQVCAMLAGFVVRLVTWSKVVFSLCLYRVFGVGFENSFSDSPISVVTRFSWVSSTQPDVTLVAKPALKAYC